ncbi:hypothetical protein [Streptomyces virginiae]|uniref:hypothetical protein n=1 Tax=Streptomyces virginiae TaxID=1961 RepID=UPI002251D26F|nr:hypothetical protein [Streptomyces virginiae]MCX4962984.1 hypothetical protein [Streptomyces virginiae]
MSLIGAVPGAWFARYRNEVPEDDGWSEGLDAGEPGYTYEPVVAWDSEGYGLVVGREAGRLVRAAEVSGFSGMYDDREKAEAEMTEDEVLERVRAEQEKRQKRERKTGG